jgi:fatty-acyl-CoA synthase
VGKASLHVEVRLVDSDGADVPQGVAGEIIIRAPTVTAGYWLDPELTARQVVDGWLHTGDMGYFDAEGFLFVSGRKPDMIVSGGMRIFPAEIEDVLIEHPDIAEVAVIGLLDEKWGEIVCAVIKPVDGATIDECEVIQYCTERLASYKKPTSVRVVDELPRSVVGRSQKSLLREHLSNRLGAAALGERAD